MVRVPLDLREPNPAEAAVRRLRNIIMSGIIELWDELPARWQGKVTLQANSGTIVIRETRPAG